MSENGPTQSGDLGPMPDPDIEPGEPNPGGADALPEEETNEPADLDPEDNPAMEEHAPDAVLDEMREDEDTDTEATSGETDDAPGQEGAGEPTA